MLIALGLIQACACDPAAEALAPSVGLTAEDLQLSELSRTLLSDTQSHCQKEIRCKGQAACMIAHFPGTHGVGVSVQGLTASLQACLGCHDISG